MTDAPVSTVSAAVDAALDAYGRLADLGEDVEDEWSYIQDLTATWRDRLELVVAERGAETVEPEIAAAIGSAIDEVERIEDPHRAIDWLSTFPQVTLIALGEAP